MKLRHIFLYFLTMLFVVPATAQTTAAGSDIVSRTLLSSDGTRAVEQRVYGDGYFGTTPSDLTLNMTLHRDNVDYLLGGSLVVKSDTVDKYLFDGGYAKKSSSGSNFIFYYYNKDHLGDNREVVSASRNAVVQVTRSTSGRLPPKGRKNYYPSGTPYADENAERGADIQPYKYNGKELDRMHGLDTYDYGARQYSPVLARWDRVDPLCEKYYSVSPYVYCMNNPINMIDPNFRLNI